MKKLTTADIRNPKRPTGYDHVSKSIDARPGRTNPKPFIAAHGKRQPGKTTPVWHGPRRATAVEAAQDYCDYMNNNQVAPSARNKSAGHVIPPKRKRRVPSDIQAARGMIRDWEAQQKGKAQGYVYLITEKLSGGGLIYGKIGYSTSPEKRVAELQTGNPRTLMLLYAMPGTEADERRLHAKYRDKNVLQEWFFITKELLLEFPANTKATVSA